MIRIYLAGEIQIESEHGLIRESDLPARQGRLAFAHLASTRDHPLARAMQRPGYVLQRHAATREPSAAELEVAQAALDEVLRLEGAAAPSAESI